MLRNCGIAGRRGRLSVNEGGVARVGRPWRHSYGGDRSGIRGLPEGAAAPTPPLPSAPRTLLSYVALEADSTLGHAIPSSYCLSLTLCEHAAGLENLCWLFPRQNRPRQPLQVSWGGSRTKQTRASPLDPSWLCLCKIEFLQTLFKKLRDLFELLNIVTRSVYPIFSYYLQLVHFATFNLPRMYKHRQSDYLLWKDAISIIRALNSRDKWT